MNTRLATFDDLPLLKNIYKDIVRVMESNGVYIWNEFYPYEEFKNDINNKCLYVVEDEESIISAFGLFKNVSGCENFKWKSSKNAIYLGRFGVNIKYQNQGLGEYSINEAKTLAKKLGYDSLRLQVVKQNIPAISFYKKIGLTQVEGINVEEIEETGVKLIEYGFEIKV